MTKEEINREIAERIMGWNDKCPWTWSDNDGYTMDVSEFNPTERIDRAWMVAEKFRQQGYWVHLFGRPEHWSCGMAHLKDTSKRDVLEKADTAPMAICLAALATKEEK